MGFVWHSSGYFPCRRMGSAVDKSGVPKSIEVFPSVCCLAIAISGLGCFSSCWHLLLVIYSLHIHLGHPWSGRLALLVWLGLLGRVMWFLHFPPYSGHVWLILRILRCIGRSSPVPYGVSGVWTWQFPVLQYPGIGLQIPGRSGPILPGYCPVVG